MKRKKGVFFSMDVLIAVSIIFMSILVVYPVLKHPYHESFVQSDLMVVLSTLKIGEINNSYVNNNLIPNGKINDLNKSLIEQVGEFYVNNITLAKELANEILLSFNTSENIGIWYGDDMLASKNKTSFENARNSEIDRQIISGISKGESVTGYSSRVYLTNSMQTKYFYFGGYVGEGNISANLNYGGDLSQIILELAVNKDFDVFINNNYSGHYTNASSELTPAIYDLSAYKSKLEPGENTIKISGENLHIAGGYIKIIYRDSAGYEEPFKYYFPGIEGVINLYDGFYIPGILNNLKISLHFNNNRITFLIIGNTSVFKNSTAGEKTINIDNNYLSSILNYSAISLKTIPLRFGMENISYVSNLSLNSDIFSVAPLPSSFNAAGGVEIIQNANRNFINEILKVSTTRVGLVGIYSDVIPNNYYHNLSRNMTSLNSTINNWNLKAGVCLCCGINKSIQGLLSSSSSIKSVVLMADDKPTLSCGGDATEDAINAACNAWTNYGIRFNTISLGNKQRGQDMLQKIANCSNGSYYQGDYSDITNLYKQAAEDLIKFIYYEQTVESTGIYSRLYPDSYIEFNYTKEKAPYGVIISYEKGFTNEYSGSFDLPNNSTIVETSVISYSGSRWTDNAKINDISVYNLSRYGVDYIRLGDPYSINIPNNLVQKNNNITITTGLSPSNSSVGSLSNKIIYKTIKNMTSYSPIYAHSNGCLWNIQFEDNTNSTMNIPNNYSGENICYYSSGRKELGDENDAINIAVYDLFKLLDSDSNGKLDIKFSEQNLEISSSEIKGIPYIWSTQIQIRRWD